MTHVLLFIPNIIGYSKFILPSYAATTLLCQLVRSIVLPRERDFMDGMFARKYNQCSEFGAILDMITDRLCTIALLIMLSHPYPTHTLYFLLMAMLDMASHCKPPHAK